MSIFFHICKWTSFVMFTFFITEKMVSVQMGHWSIAKAEMTSQCKSQKVTIYTYIPWYNVYYIDLSGIHIHKYCMVVNKVPLTKSCRELFWYSVTYIRHIFTMFVISKDMVQAIWHPNCKQWHCFSKEALSEMTLFLLSIATTHGRRKVHERMLVILAAQPEPNGRLFCLHSFKVF